MARLGLFEARRRRSGGRRGAGACDSGDREDAEEPDRISQDEAGTLESVLKGITTGTQSSQSCRIRAEDYSDPDGYPTRHAASNPEGADEVPKASSSPGQPYAQITDCWSGRDATGLVQD